MNSNALDRYVALGELRAGVVVVRRRTDGLYVGTPALWIEQRARDGRVCLADDGASEPISDAIWPTVEAMRAAIADWERCMSWER